jgi:hypothetical protein
MPETTPSPVLRTFNQPTLDRIAMNVAKLLYELAMVPDIEVEVPLQPERLRGS